MPFRRWFAMLLGILLLLLSFHFLGGSKHLVERWKKSQPPAPFRFVSLRDRSDDQIARFMSGIEADSPFHPADAPDSHFPDEIWKMAPKAAALAFAEANRRPCHRRQFTLTVDGNPSFKAPDAGWIVFDPGSASCPLSSSGTTTLTALRFGINQPFLFHAATYESGGWSTNPRVDSPRHSQQLIPLSPDEARFLADTIFWLEHIQSEDVRNREQGIGSIAFTGHSSTSIHSTADAYGRLDWHIAGHPPRRITETLWATSSIASHWSGEYDAEASLNLVSFLLSEALPRHLGDRWQSEPAPVRNARNIPFEKRLESRQEPAVQENLTRVILSALARHEADPWPAEALIALAECAGDAGLVETLPALEALSGKLPPPSANESEMSALDDQFRLCWEAPANPGERKKWDRYKALKQSLENEFPAQVRPRLAESTRQLRVLGNAAALADMAKGSDSDAMWALRRLYQLSPDAYLDSLTARFPAGEAWDRRAIFEVLASLKPSAARRLCDSLMPSEIAAMLLEITRFELDTDPQGARVRIPALFDIAENPTEQKPGERYPSASMRGPAIELLVRMPLDAVERERFERLLVKELTAPETDEISGKHAISAAAAAVVSLPDPDRFWTAVHTATEVEKGYLEFNALLDALATLALAKPEPHLAQIAELLRLRISRHEGSMDTLCMAALALNLRTLAPEIQHFATSGPAVPDGENPPVCKDVPCLHRYHSARHVSALWQEPDADTRARMWTAQLLASPYSFVGTKTIPSCLRDHCRSAITAATPAIRKQLISRISDSGDLPDELLEWLGDLP